MTISEFVAQNSGKLLDFDGAYGAQCVDLAQFWAQAIGLPRFWGNAVDIKDQASGSASWVANTPTNYPQPGDIIVWSAGVRGVTGQFGHVALAVDANPQSFNSFDQNWPTGSAAHIQHHNYLGVAGWLHPVAVEAGYTELTTVATTGVAGCRVRAQDNTTSADNQGSGNLRGGVQFNVTGWAHGENVQSNDIWYRTLRGNWVWSGGTAEGTSLVGGIGGGNVVSSEALEIVTPEPTPAPAPVPVVVPPAPVQPEPSVTPPPLPPEAVVPPRQVEMRPVTGTATLASRGYVTDLTTLDEIAEVPAGTVINVAGTKVVAGTVFLVTQNMVRDGLNEGIASTYFVRRGVDSVGPKHKVPVTLAEVPKVWQVVLKFLHVIHFHSKKTKKEL